MKQITFNRLHAGSNISLRPSIRNSGYLISVKTEHLPKDKVLGFKQMLIVQFRENYR